MACRASKCVWLIEPYSSSYFSQTVDYMYMYVVVGIHICVLGYHSLSIPLPTSLLPLPPSPLLLSLLRYNSV